MSGIRTIDDAIKYYLLASSLGLADAMTTSLLLSRY